MATSACREDRYPRAGCGCGCGWRLRKKEKNIYRIPARWNQLGCSGWQPSVVGLHRFSTAEPQRWHRRGKQHKKGLFFFFSFPSVRPSVPQKGEKVVCKPKPAQGSVAIARRWVESPSRHFAPLAHSTPPPPSRSPIKYSPPSPSSLPLSSALHASHGSPVATVDPWRSQPTSRRSRGRRKIGFFFVPDWV